jgi:hypothetical protein
MIISYEVAFDSGFDWVKGGKLPGLRGGPDPNNCSGGNQANGTNCFSSRLMWRTDGAGEGASNTFAVGRDAVLTSCVQSICLYSATEQHLRRLGHTVQ